MSNEAKKQGPQWVEVLAIDGSHRPLSMYAYRGDATSPQGIPHSAELLPGLGVIPSEALDALTGAIDREEKAGHLKLIDPAKMKDADLVALIGRSIDHRALTRLVEVTSSGTVREAARARAEYVRGMPIGFLLHDPTSKAA